MLGLYMFLSYLSNLLYQLSYIIKHFEKNKQK